VTIEVMTVANKSLALLVINGVSVNATGFWDTEEGDDGTEKLKGEEDPEHTGETDGAWVHFVVCLRPPVESDTRENGTELSNSGAETVGKTTNTRWENFTGDDESGSVWSEVEEELGDDNETESGSRAEMRCASKDTECECGDKETLDLDPFAAENLNEGNREEITRNVTSNGNNQVTLGVVEKVLVWGSASGVTDGLEDSRLVQVDTVESNIDQKP